MKKKINFLIYLSITFIVSLIFAFINLGLDLDGDYYIFSDINECLNLKNDNSKIEMSKYDSPQNDQHLGNLKYNDFCAAKYKSKELEFEIFAYEFNSVNDAKAYFKNGTGKESENNYNFTASTGLFGPSEIIVFKNEKAYTVYVAKKYLNKTKEILKKNFTGGSIATEVKTGETGVLIADNITGVGVADDSLLAGSTACFVGGIDGVFGKKVCTECGAVRYGY